jgi:predicted DNA-binding protein with PD1-like motif
MGVTRRARHRRLLEESDLRWQRTTWGYVVALESGEEIVASLQAFAEQRGIRAGAISAIGAVGTCELGFFIRASSSYSRRTFEGEHEIGVLTGNFSELDGRPVPHCHVVIAGEDLLAHTGHLFRGIVTVTCEIQIVTDEAVIHRAHRPDLGFNPLELPNA